MNEQEVSQKLDDIIVARLFGHEPWLVDRETGAALSRTLSEMGLEEQVLGKKDTSRLTALGSKLNVDLMMVFMGLYDEGDIPYVLEKHTLIDEFEADAIYDALEAGGDPERLLRNRVQQAYFDYYNPCKRRQ
jgi:hypothetical protein